MQTERMQRVYELFHEINALPELQRLDALRQRCGDDEELYKETQALLKIGVTQETLTARHDSTDTIQLNPGDRVGHYVIREQIGEGGFAVVYAADQEKPVRRRVALKIIKLGMDTKQVIARFEAERQALAMMDHPHVAKVFDAGATDTGRPYFVMEHVPGVSITEHCDRQRLSIAERLHLFMQVCEAVQHAHQKGIIHRDIKPSNVLILTKDGKAVPKVIDFGVAKALHQKLTEQTIYTEQGQLIGTPEYMSPEQAEMTAQDIDTRSDIYSLGVVLYELLTGALPIEPTTLRRAAFGEIQRIIREEEPPKPSTRLSSLGDDSATSAKRRRVDPKSLYRELRGDLDWIVMKALEKDRNRRYETANGLAMDIGRYLDDEPVIARPPSAGYRFRKFARRNKGLLTAGTVVAAALVGGLALATWGMVRAQRERDSADAARVTAQEQRRLAVQLQREAQDAHAIAKTQRQRAEDALAEVEVRAYTASLAAAAADLERNDPLSLRRRLTEAPQQLRGWEWHYLWNEADRSIATPLTLPPAANGYRMGLSADGTLVAARRVRNDAPIEVYDARSGELRMTIQPSFNSNNPRFMFSPDNRYLAYPHDSTSGVQIFDLSDGSALVPKTMFRSYREFIGFDPSGETVALLHISGTVGLYRIDGWISIGELPGNWSDEGRWWLGGSFSPDGRLLAVGARPPHPMHVYDIESGRSVAEISEPTKATRVRFSPDGARLATLAWDGTIRVYDTETWKPVREIEHPPSLGYGDIRFVEVSGLLTVLAATSDGVLSMYWTSEARQSFDLRGHGAVAWSIAVDSEREEIVTAHADGVVRRWDLHHPRQSHDFDRSLAFSPDGSMLHVGMVVEQISGGQQVYTVDPLTSQTIGHLHFFPHSLDHVSLASMAINPDGRYLALATDCDWGWGRVKVFDLFSGLGVGSADPGVGDLNAIAWSADGRRIAAGSEDGSLVIYDVDPLGLVRMVTAHDGAVTDVAFAPDSGRLLTASRDGTVRIWDAEGRQLVAVLGSQGGPGVRSLAFSPDTELLVAGRDDGTMTVWDLDSFELVVEVAAHGSPVSALAFLSAPGQPARLASGSADRSVKIWDPTTWRELVALHMESRVDALAFSPDGTRLAIGQYGGVVRIADGAPELDRKKQRRTLADARRLAGPLVVELMERHGDPPAVWQRIMASPTLTDVSRRAALSELMAAASETVAEAYATETVERIVRPHASEHYLRNQLLVKGYADCDVVAERVGALPGLTEAERQAAMEYAVACRFGMDNLNDLATEILEKPGRSDETYAIAWFGLEPLIEAYPDFWAIRHTYGMGQYRLGLLTEALTTFQRVDERLAGDSGSNPANLAFMAMIQHRLGRSQRAAELMAELETAMELPDYAGSDELILFRDEARTVLDGPVPDAVDEDAAQEKAAALRDQLQIGVPRDRSAMLTMARKHREASRYAEAAELYEKAAPLTLEAVGRKSKVYAELLEWLAWTYFKMGNLDDAIRVRREAAETYRLIGPRHHELTQQLAWLGDMLSRAGQVAEAERFFRERIELEQTIHNGMHQDVEQALAGLAGLLASQKRFQEAAQIAREAVEIRRSSMGPESIEVASALRWTADVLRQSGELDDAESFGRDALALYRAIKGYEHADTVPSLMTLGTVLEDRQQLGEAEQLLRQAIAILRATNAENSANVRQAVDRLLALLERRGDPTMIEAAWRESLGRYRSTAPDDQAGIGSRLVRLGMVLVEQGKHAVAESVLRECLAVRREYLPADHWLIYNTMSVLGESLAGQGTFTEAEALLVEAYEKMKPPSGPAAVRRREGLARIVALYQAWGAAEPGSGYDARAAEWRAKLPTEQDAVASDPPTDEKQDE